MTGRGVWHVRGRQSENRSGSGCRARRGARRAGGRGGKGGVGAGHGLGGCAGRAAGPPTPARTSRSRPGPAPSPWSGTVVPPRSWSARRTMRASSGSPATSRTTSSGSPASSPPGPATGGPRSCWSAPSAAARSSTTWSPRQARRRAASRASGRPRCSRSSSDPLPGVRRAFVIAGSDQRGTIYGAYDVSRQIGVSPWYCWDDVPPRHRDALYVLPGPAQPGHAGGEVPRLLHQRREPGARAPGRPAYFGPGKAPGFPGGFNADFYAKVFEVMLRLKANYLWPAVWGRAFAEDDPREPRAPPRAYGVVMGTSHEAPMMRGIEEWNRHAVAAVRDSEGNITTPGATPTAAPASGASAATPTRSRRTGATASAGWWTRTSRASSPSACAATATSSLPDGDGIDADAGHPRHRAADPAEETGERPRRRSRRSGPSTRRSSATGTRACARRTT